MFREPVILDSVILNVILKWSFAYDSSILELLFCFHMPKDKIPRCKDYLSEQGFHMEEGKRNQVSRGWRDSLEGGLPEGTEQTLMLHRFA